MKEPQVKAVASDALLGEMSAALAERLAAKVMDYIGKQVCIGLDITRSDIAAMFANDLLVFIKSNQHNPMGDGTDGKQGR